LKRHWPNRQGRTREPKHLFIPADCIRLFAFAATMTFETTDANAVVCARGVYRAGCAGYRGAVVVARPPTVICRTVRVNGVRVRRCG
jgi:hypothetical protein